MIITMTHVRMARYCRRGAMAFCNRHGLDWSKFLRDGLPERDILATGDAMAKKVVEIAHGV